MNITTEPTTFYVQETEPTTESIESNKLLKEEIDKCQDEIELSLNEMIKAGKKRLIRGRNLDQWNKQFVIEIDYNADPNHVNLLIKKLCDNLELAQQHLNTAKFEARLYKNYYNTELRERIEQEANRKGRKTPGLQTMETLAESALGLQTTVKEFYHYEIMFWEDVIRKINTQIELVKILSISIGTKYKIGNY